MIVATSLVKVSNLAARSLSETCNSPFSKISRHIFVLSLVPKTLIKSSFLATRPFDTFVNME